MRSPILKGLLIFAIVFLAYTFYKRNIAPKPETTSSVVQEGSPQQLPQDFIDFYDRFQSDSSFQLSMIVFPLMKISDDTSTVGGYWTEENWTIHKPFNDMGGTFERTFDIKGTFINEYISDSSGEFTMNRRFAKLADGWHLIYYRPMGQYTFESDLSEKSSKIEIKQLEPK